MAVPIAAASPLAMFLLRLWAQQHPMALAIALVLYCGIAVDTAADIVASLNQSRPDELLQMRALVHQR